MSTSRRRFLQTTGTAAVATALPSIALPHVHMSSQDEIRVALVGCGGRGSGAAVNAVMAKGGTQKLYAMADSYEDRLKSSYENLSKNYAKHLNVTPERQFVGFDAYKHAMDALRPGDIVILATPPAFRWVHFQYAISKKLNVFMEKPVTVDGPTSRRMLELGKQAEAAGLRVGVGLMSRHARNMEELHDRVRNGELGEILLMRGYRMHGPAGYSESTPKPADISDLDYQIRRFHSVLWASGGCFSDFYIHIVDHLCWIKGALPVKCKALGGRHYKATAEGIPFVDQNLDTYSCEYTFADGTKMYFDGRCVNGAQGMYSSYIHGTKGMAIASRANDCGGPSAIHSGHNPASENLVWQSKDNTNPYQNEWDDLMAAIRGGKPFNELQHGVEASLISSMGRMAAHTGQEITWQDMLNCEHEFAPGLDTLTKNSPAPLQPGSDGRYPIPRPGLNPKREF